MIITRGQLVDLPEIVAIEQAGFASGAWSDTSWRGELEADDRLVLTARGFEGAVLGVAAFQSVAETADLNRVVVHPVARGQGLGRALVRAGCDWALTKGAERMVLEVDMDNAPALGLYRSLGFTDLALRKDYYGPGTDALVMERDLVEVDEWQLVGGLL